VCRRDFSREKNRFTLNQVYELTYVRIRTYVYLLKNKHLADTFFRTHTRAAAVGFLTHNGKNNENRHANSILNFVWGFHQSSIYSKLAATASKYVAVLFLSKAREGGTLQYRAVDVSRKGHHNQQSIYADQSRRR